MSIAAADEDLYQALILERARSPRHGSLLACFDAEAEGENAMCGDRLTLRLRHDDGGRIAAAGFKARGCAISVAAADLMADVVEGLDAAAARALAERFTAMVVGGEVPDDPAFGTLRAFAGVHAYRSRRRCATLAWDALEKALAPRAAQQAAQAVGGTTA